MKKLGSSGHAVRQNFRNTGRNPRLCAHQLVRSEPCVRNDPLQPVSSELEIDVVVLILVLQLQIRPFGNLLTLIPAVARELTVTVPCHHPGVCFYLGLPYQCMCRESVLDVHIQSTLYKCYTYKC